MKRDFYLEMASSGKYFPVATHLVLHEKADPEAILVDGKRLSEVMIETARRFDSPLALPIMDLTLEKDIMLRCMGIAEENIPKFHFEEPLDSVGLDAIDVLLSPRIKANAEALAIISDAHREGAREVAVGMSVGPFSLLTKLLSDPITPIFMACTGVSAEEDQEVALLQSLLGLCEKTVHACCQAQIDAGAAAIFVCEPAANLVYFSPAQMKENGFSVFNDFVINPNLRLKSLLDVHGVDLIFHDCGSLTPEMVESFAVLDPVILSLGSPNRLWEIAHLVPKNTVIYGNLPTKKFYSDEEVPLEGISHLVKEIEDKMKATGRPFIIGSECDVLSMPGYEKTIMDKVMAFSQCRCGH